MNGFIGTDYRPKGVNAPAALLAVLFVLGGAAVLGLGADNGSPALIALGVLLFIAPWVMGYTEFNGASWTSWIAGVLTVIAGAAAMPVANAAHRTAGQH